MKILKKFYWSLPLNIFIGITILLQTCHLSSFRNIRIHKQSGSIVIRTLKTDEEQLRLTVARRERLHLYLDGIAERLDNLALQYLINFNELDRNGLIIDIGANIGEFSFSFKRNGFTNFLCIEPERTEAEICDKNIYSGEHKTLQTCLFSSQGTVKFYHHNETGDSSAFPNNLNWPYDEIECNTLDNIVIARSITAIELIKLEAEGAEPEVLQGAVQSLKITKYVLADLGSERGPSEESTFHDANRILVESGFLLVEMGGQGFRESYKYRNLLLT